MLMNLPTMGPHYGKKWCAGRGEAVAAPSKKSCQRACESESGTVFRLPPEIYEKVINSTKLTHFQCWWLIRMASMFRFC